MSVEQPAEKADTRVTTIRLPEDIAVEVELVARVLRVSVSEVIRTAIAEYLTKRTGEAEFARRLAERIEKDAVILRRLGGDEHDPGVCIATDPTPGVVHSLRCPAYRSTRPAKPTPPTAGAPS